MLHTRCREPNAQLFDVSGDEERADLAERELSVVTPASELCDRLGVSGTRVGVADVGGEEVTHAAPCLFAGVKEQRRQGSALTRRKLTIGPRCGLIRHRATEGNSG